MFLELLNRLELWVVAIRAGPRDRHSHHPIDAGRLGPLPGWMTYRSTALFALRRNALAGRGSSAAFELAAVQGLELSLKLLVLEFCLFTLASLRVQFLVEFFQLIFVVAFGAGDLLIAMKDPASGESFQIRAPIPIRATEVVG
jgi:hypothetical protein